MWYPLQALSDASFAIRLNPNQVCGWILRGLFKKIKVNNNVHDLQGNPLVWPRTYSTSKHHPPFCIRHINTSCMSFNSGFELLTPSLYLEKLKCPKVVFANKNDREGLRYSSNKTVIISYINIVKRCCKLPISSPGKISSDLNRRLIIFKSNIKISLQN